MNKTTITCDSCGSDITESPLMMSDAFGLRLTNFVRPHRGNATLVHVVPMLERDMDFCGPRCLHAWAGKQIELAEIERMRHTEV